MTVQGISAVQAVSVEGGAGDISTVTDILRAQVQFSGSESFIDDMVDSILVADKASILRVRGRREMRRLGRMVGNGSNWARHMNYSFLCRLGPLGWLKRHTKGPRTSLVINVGVCELCDGIIVS